jgi:tetratricopeptide (TPR) repeat protein
MAYQSEIEKLEQRFGEKPEQWFAALADAYRKAGDLDMALDVINTWIEKRPNYTSGHIVRGRCLLDRQQDAEAAQAFQGVLELDPENIIAIKALSEIATRAGDEEQARQWLRRLLEVDPMNEEAHAALEAMSPQPAALELVEPTPAEAAPPADEPATAAPMFDPMAIAHDLRESAQVEQVTEEAAPEELEVPSLREVGAAEPTLEMEPELAIEPAAEVEGLETSEVSADAGDAADSGIEIEAFDEEMGWDAGDRVSHAISQEDIEEAQHAHENSLDVPAHSLPGIETEDVPEVGVEERVSQAIEGLDVPPQVPEVEPEPVMGFEPTVEEPAVEIEEEEPAAAVQPEPVPIPVPMPEPATELAVPVEPVEPEPTPVSEAVPEPAQQAATGPADTPGTEPAEAEAEAEEELPLILPEEVQAEDAAEPEPLLTETMAEVYVAQGHEEQARDIYRKLLAQQPGNAALAAKLRDLESRAAPQPAAAPPPPAPSLEERFAAAATGRASVSVVLAEILGTEPQPAVAPPPRPAGAEPPTPAPAPAAAPPATPQAAPAAPEGGDEDFTFDEFFGDEKPGAGPGPPEQPAAEDKGSDDDFRGWLKSLKT